MEDPSAKPPDADVHMKEAAEEKNTPRKKPAMKRRRSKLRCWKAMSPLSSSKKTKAKRARHDDVPKSLDLSAAARDWETPKAQEWTSGQETWDHLVEKPAEEKWDEWRGLGHAGCGSADGGQRQRGKPERKKQQEKASE